VSNGFMLNDFRFALRVLRKSPAFLVAAVLSLALGIGATTVVFGAFRAVFLRPLPCADPDRLVEITKLTLDGRNANTTVADVQFLRQFSRSFESFGTSAFYHAMPLSGFGEPASVLTRAVEPAAALAEMERMRPALTQQYPEAQREFRFHLDLLGEREMQKYR